MPHSFRAKLSIVQELGAIRLRMQWVHSLKGLISHLANWSDAKLLDIEQQGIQIQKEKLERQDDLRQKGVQDDVLGQGVYFIR